jgi:anti-sigma B factor antagonist
MEMDVDELAGQVTCIRLDGRLDAPGAARIDVPFTAHAVASGRNTLVDLSGVTFIASMGIRLLIAAARGLDRKGAKLVLFGARDLVREVLAEAAIDQIIAVTDSEDEALRKLGA